MTYKERYEYQKEITLKQKEEITRQKAEIKSLNKDLADTISLNYKERQEQKAEIERLRDLNGLLAGAGQKWQERYETAKAEAVKKFAERLKSPILSQLGISTLEKKESYYFCLDEIDNLVKELVGEDSSTPIVDN